MDDGLTWIDGAGQPTPLDDPPHVEPEWGVEGRFAPPFAFVADEVAGLPGSRVRNVRADVRDVEVPLAVTGTSRADLRDRLRTLASAFDPTRGDGRLRWGDRELVARYAEGFEGAEVLDDGIYTQRAVVVFRAFDPYWRDADATTRTVEISDIAFLSVNDEPWFEWQLVAADALGEFVIDNDGDAPAWPVWTIHGPGSTPTLTNETTGEVIEIDVALTASETVEIDTRPGYKTVTAPNGTSAWPQLSDASTLWPLPAGGSTIKLELADAEAGVSNVRLEYRRRWLTV